ncbi:MAG: IstB-like ATP-binding domain-containing protein [Rhodoferax sp.]|nr:IstB-like ATP-binding domain-containing protein [Rhodoferax sp.]
MDLSSACQSRATPATNHTNGESQNDDGFHGTNCAACVSKPYPGRLEQQLSQSGISALSFEERLALLVDREVHGRQDRRCARLLKCAKLNYPQATIEDLDSRSTRGFERSAVMSLAMGEWVKCGHAVFITGATGVGQVMVGVRSGATRLPTRP